MTNKFDANIQRIFSLVPIIYKNQGIPLGELMQKLSYSKLADLHSDLDRLMMFGIPPYSPADFISIHIEDDRVYLDYPLGLEKPLDLNSMEWLVLQKIIMQERSFQSAESHNTAIMDELLKKISSIPVLMTGADQNQQKRSLIQEALEEGIQIEFLYSSLASKQAELRRLDPWVFFEHKKSGYVMGFCHTRQQARNFLIDRMSEIQLLEMELEVKCPDNIYEMVHKTEIFNPSPKGFTVKLAFEKSLLQHLQWILGLENIQKAHYPEFEINDWLEASAKINSTQWFLESVLRLGPAIAILEPVFLKEKYCQMIAGLDQIELLRN